MAAESRDILTREDSNTDVSLATQPFSRLACILHFARRCLTMAVLVLSRFTILLCLIPDGLTIIAHGFQNCGVRSSFRNMKSKNDGRPPSQLSSLPKLIVFDLDNTIWSPELYQLRNLQRANTTPVAGRDVKLFKGAQAALNAKTKLPGIKFAVASRTKSVDWAHDLLDQFGIRHLFDHIEIFPGNKQAHFKNIADSSGIHYSDMIFFDDQKDGKYGNCEPVSRMGVLSVHCPGGLHSEEIFENALERFKEWDRSPNTIVEWNGEMTIDSRQEGVVKTVNRGKRYGFICYGDHTTKDLFFHYSSLPDDRVIGQGDKLSFVVKRDPKTGKNMAVNVEIESSTVASKDTVEMRVFSMNMPFAALLVNGYKTLETRNGTMFVPYPDGTQMLLHVGHRNYPDGNKHIEVMKSGGLNEDQIKQLKMLPNGFGKGMVVAIVELGKTYDTTVEERSHPEFQRHVAAFGSDSGRMVTEIKRVQYLKRPVVVSGQGGVFKAQIDPEIIPDGWLQPSTEKPYQVKSSDDPEATSSSSSTSSGSKPVFSISG